MCSGTDFSRAKKVWRVNKQLMVYTTNDPIFLVAEFSLRYLLIFKDISELKKQLNIGSNIIPN